MNNENNQNNNINNGQVDPNKIAQAIPVPEETNNITAVTSNEQIVNDTQIAAQTSGQVEPQVIKQVEKKVEGKAKTIHKETIKEVRPKEDKKNKNNGSNNTVIKTEKKGPFKYILLILFFIGLLVLVWFLPEIREYFATKEVSEKEEVINGNLKCILEDEGSLTTTLYTSEFDISNNQLKSYTSTIETKGDTGSEEDLTKLNDDCEFLTEMLDKVSGVSSDCKLNSRKQTSIQMINYSKVDTKKLSSAYTEAGGINPGYKFNQNVKEIKLDMEKTGYSCTVN